jgi:hypothetical protein
MQPPDALIAKGVQHLPTCGTAQLAYLPMPLAPFALPHPS